MSRMTMLARVRDFMADRGHLTAADDQWTPVKADGWFAILCPCGDLVELEVAA
jgi:hypothetical protein